MILDTIINGIVEIIEGFLRLVGNIIGAIIIILILIALALVCSCITTGHLPF